MLQNLSAVAANYRAGIRRFVLACFVGNPGEVAGVREALGMPLRAVRLEARLPGIGRRLAGDVTSGRRDDLRAAAASIGAAEGTGVEDVVIGNHRPAGVTARVVMTFPGWLQDPLVRPRGLRPCREGSGQRRRRGPTGAQA